MDTWLQRHLIDTGAITERNRLTRTPRPRTCPICRRRLLASQDMGREIWCDPDPISALGEVAAIATGRATYTRAAGELSLRHPTRITYRSADDEPVHAQHVCGQPQPPPNPRYATPARATDHTTEPPPY